MPPQGEAKQLSQLEHSKAKPLAVHKKVPEAETKAEDDDYELLGLDDDSDEDEPPRGAQRASKMPTGLKAKSGNPATGRPQGAATARKNHTAQRAIKSTATRRAKTSAAKIKKEDRNHDYVITTNKYKMRGVLDEKEDKDGNIHYQIDWAPTWELADVAELTPEAQEAWERLKTAREEQERMEKDENNHVVITWKAQTEQRQRSSYLRIREKKLATLSAMDASIEVASTEALKWFTTFKDDILSELELLFLTEEGYQLRRKSKKEGDIIFPKDDKRSHDKYALWVSYNQRSTPPGCLGTQSPAPYASGRPTNENDSDRDQDGDTTLQDEDNDGTDDGEEDEDPDTEGIILALVPNPHYHKGSPESPMPCGVLCLQGIASLRDSINFFATKKKRPPVKQLFDMMLEAFGAPRVRIAPIIRTNDDQVSLTWIGDEEEYEYVAREVRFTSTDRRFEWIGDPNSTSEATTVNAEVQSPEPAATKLSPATPAPRDALRLKKETSKIPDPVRAFGSGGAAIPSGKSESPPGPGAAASGNSGQRQPLPTAKPAHAQAVRQKQVDTTCAAISTPAAATRASPAYNSTGTTGKVVPAKRKSTSKQTYRHHHLHHNKLKDNMNMKGKAKDKDDVYDFAGEEAEDDDNDDDDENDDDDPRLKSESMSLVGSGDEIDLDEGQGAGPGPSRPAAGLQLERKSLVGTTQAQASKQRRIVKNVTPGSEVRSLGKKVTGKVAKRGRGK